MTKEKLSATVFFKPGTLKPRKYRNITQPKRFEAYMAAKDAYYINYYDARGQFKGRVWLKNFD